MNTNDSNPRRAIPFIRKYMMRCEVMRGIIMDDGKEYRMYKEYGMYNGYVAIPPTNGLYGKDYMELDDLIDIHGGVTYSESAKDSAQILDDNARFLLSGDSGIPSDWWIIGFDTRHAGDTLQKWTRERTIQETLDLYIQVLKY